MTGTSSPTSILPSIASYLSGRWLSMAASLTRLEKERQVSYPPPSPSSITVPISFLFPKYRGFPMSLLSTISLFLPCFYFPTPLQFHRLIPVLYKLVDSTRHIFFSRWILHFCQHFSPKTSFYPRLMKGCIYIADEMVANEAVRINIQGGGGGGGGFAVLKWRYMWKRMLDTSKEAAVVASSSPLSFLNLHSENYLPNYTYLHNPVYCYFILVKAGESG
ncbi:hypothetical protein L2E82_36220 [Cichorium intybus]|uniref:Uncharacterized protein n=1 Tax=Cichorium intybus TaxID=13427 RepID=A0ACB9BQY9_CICIN|nr:hypothetical protein L2E82_36220 [Cichorium intybus]